MEVFRNPSARPSWRAHDPAGVKHRKHDQLQHATAGRVFDRASGAHSADDAQDIQKDSSNQSVTTGV